jgi:hypothetical protein
LLSFAGENHPAVKNCGATLAAAAGFDSDRVCGPLDNVSKANVFITDKSGQSHPVRLAFSLIVRRFFLLPILHALEACEAAMALHKTCEADEGLAQKACEADEGLAQKACEADEGLAQKACEAGDSIKPGAQAPGSRLEKAIEPVKRATAWNLQAVTRCRGLSWLSNANLGLAPQALCCRLLRRLRTAACLRRLRATAGFAG